MTADELKEEITTLRRSERVLLLQNDVLDLIARDAPLQTVLDRICTGFEELSRPGTYASVMLADEKHQILRMTSGPTIPQPVVDALVELPIGENEGSCGTAVFRGEQVTACDIGTDKVWEKYRDFALGHDLHACWSTPFRNASGRVLGSFALTQTEARSPTQNDFTHMQAGANLCALAVEQSQRTEHMNKLSLAVEQNPGAIAITDPGGRIEYINRRFSELTQFSLPEVEGRLLPEMLSLDYGREDLEQFWKKLIEGEEWRMKARYRRKDGTSYWAQCYAAAVTNTADTVTHIVVSHDDITELHEASEKVAYQAQHDQLTGLINRCEFERRLHLLRSRALENDETHSLCFIDMDRFKAVNDSCGHTGGDELLRQIADLMSHSVRRQDTLARVGGDEFAILFEFCDREQAKRNVEQIRKQVADYRFAWKDQAYHVGLSAGLVEIDAHSPSAEELFNEADVACYQAKTEGRNQVHVFQGSTAPPGHQSRELQCVNILRNALDEDNLVLYQQRIKSVLEGKPDNAEILLRLKSPAGDLISPGEFLPAAERFGLARQVDSWVVENVFRYLAQHPAYLESLGYCAINLSGLSLGREFGEEIISLLDRLGLDGRSICFEVTETAAIANLSQAQQFISELQARGIRFALDDFGSGLSSFGYLKTLPFDILKIDGQFVRDILEDSSNLAIVSSIAELGQALGCPTVAEFVEDRNLLQVLRNLGVDYAQGYGIGKPEPLV